MPKPSALVKPTPETKFHIDYDWWERDAQDLRLYLLTHLSPNQRDKLSEDSDTRYIDFINPDTGEVSRLTELQYHIRLAAQQSDFINPHTSLVDSVFRIFLANGNTPLSPNDLSARLDRPANTILKAISGPRIYKGIRPVLS